jgi:hypothetical protein
MSLANCYHEDSIAVGRELGNQGLVANELNNLANVFHFLGILEKANSLQEEGVSLATKSGFKKTLAYLTSANAEVLTDEGNLSDARAKHAQALAIWKDLHDELNAGYDQVALAALDLETDRQPKLDRLNESIGNFKSDEDHVNEASGRFVLAEALARQGDESQARKQMELASQLAAKSANQDIRIRSDLASAQVFSILGDFVAAQRAATSALHQAKRLGYVTHEFAARLILAEIDLKQKRNGVRERLSALQQQATQKKFGLIADKCSRLLR